MWWWFVGGLAAGVPLGMWILAALKVSRPGGWRS